MDTPALLQALKGKNRAARGRPLFICGMVLLALSILGLSGQLPGISSQAEAAQNSIRIAQGETSRNLSIALNKTVVVRLPVAARDVLVGNPETVPVR